MDKLVSGIKNIKIYDNTLFHLDEVNEKYDEYLKILMDLEPRKLKCFLEYIKRNEIINNHETELEDRFLLELYQMTKRKDSIDIMMKHYEDGDITKEELKKIHRIVIKGSSDDKPENYNYRKDNEKWVGFFGTNGEKNIQYMPPDYKELDELITYTLDYLNENNTNFDNLFLKPLIVHALIAYLQPFGNGNTRVARVIQHGKICKSTNELYNTNFQYPTLYLSERYLLTRAQYRGLIKDISIEKDNDSWNRWFKYNLNLIGEQLNYITNEASYYRNSL